MPQRSLPATFARLASLGAALCLSLLAQPTLAQGEDWSTCAQEGQTCRVNDGGEALVRFGADGRYAFRVTGEAQPCTVEAFGSDPAAGVRKRCEVSRNWRQQSRYRDWQQGGGGNGEWQLCANEGDYCRVPGPTRVRYGATGRYVEREVNGGGLACNNGVFGDPVQGMAKQCAYRRVSGGGSGGNGGGSGLPWNHCAREGEQCSFRGPGMLRYGAAGRYAYREANGGLRCNNDAFGADPAPGQAKRCELLNVR